MVEEEEEGKKKFVPWNVQLAELQNWINQVVVNPDESLDEFIQRFEGLRDEARLKVEKTIKKVFKEGDQGFDERIKPVNLIITPQGKDGTLYRASIKAGFYPFLVKPEEAVEVISKLGSGQLVESRELEILWRFFHSYTGWYSDKAAAITIDERSKWYPEKKRDESGHKYDTLLADQFGKISDFIFELQRKDVVFAAVFLRIEGDKENHKKAHGLYQSYNDQEYALLLNKLKTDLLLTMFLRGGAPIVK